MKNVLVFSGGFIIGYLTAKIIEPKVTRILKEQKKINLPKIKMCKKKSRYTTVNMEENYEEETNKKKFKKNK